MSSNNQDSVNNIAGAIEYPARRDDPVPLPIQPRQPRNLQGLLRFAMEATKAEDAPGSSEFGPMDVERREFLEEALRSLTVNVVEVLQNAIKVLNNTEKIHSIQGGDPVPEDVQSAFSNLLEFVDDIDVANDFYKLGGFSVFPVCLGCSNDEVRALASGLLAEICQNNPHCQARVLETGLLNVLLNLLHSESGSALTKCIYAISCACREHEPACRELVAQGGCGALAALLSTQDVRARTKAAFLVRYLCRHYNDAKEQFIEQNIVKIIAGQIAGGRDDTTEYFLSILQALVEGLDPTVLSQCRDTRINLRNILEEHLKHPDLQSDTYVEEKEYCQEILQRVFENYPQMEGLINNEADR